MEIHAYSDGGCSGNPGPGGWAYIIVTSGTERIDSGGEPETTNNRMELTAVIRALQDLAGDNTLSSARVLFHTDSQYVQKGITKWISGWEKNGWKTSNKKPVKNQDLWKLLRKTSIDLNVEWRWVRGHAGNEFNERCDSMVQAEIRKWNSPADY
jgi:ribonuclease HI